MLFNSIEFAIFLPIVFLLYWFVTKNQSKSQNLLLLIASYFFYGFWDWRLLFLLAFLSLANYLIGIRIDKKVSDNKTKVWFILGLLVNLGVLITFKYYHFFIDGFIELIALSGYDLPKSTTQIILPIGVSFYVFLSLSYIIDIYKKNLSANKNLIDVLLTFSFFPIILAGPIQRPVSLLPQFAKKREFKYDQAAEGLKQILWGLFVKVVIADNLARYVNDFFLNYSTYSGSTLLLGIFFYAVQIYADFSGYSDMAIGIAKLFGINLMRNFAYPYFGRDITEFWKRWHISLTTWFRDYVFLPLSFAVAGRLKGEKVIGLKTDLFLYIFASTVVWSLTGLWHGANYTFIVWGMIHGFFLIIYQIQKKPRNKLFKRFGIKNDQRIVVFLESFVTLCIVLIAWVFFRAQNIEQAINYLSIIFSPSLFSIPSFQGMRRALTIIIIVIAFFIIEWHGRDQQYAIANLGITWKRPYRYALYYVLAFVIFWLTSSAQQFIYLQF